jgi:fluoride exporter
MTRILLVGLGGATGSILRYLAGNLLQRYSTVTAFPLATLAVNIIGCFVIGLLAHLAEARGIFTDDTRALIFIGVLGGFTTFSSFGNETVNLFRDGRTGAALLNIGLHLIVGFGAVWAGRAMGGALWK